MKLFYSFFLLSAFLLHLSTAFLTPKDYHNERKNAEAVGKKANSKNARAEFAPLEPQQIHLSWDGEDGHMTITWNTLQLDASEPTVAVWGYSNDVLSQKQHGTEFLFTDGGDAHSAQYIHTVTLTGLEQNSHYYYRVGSASILSNETYVFRQLQAKAANAGWQPRLMIFGDMGTTNSRSFLEMTKEAIQQHSFDLIVHDGDFAYDMADSNGQNGDDFMNMIQPLAAYVPYLTTAGNHEQMYNFSHYVNRFQMPGGAQGLYYSVDMGPIHYVFICTEFYFFPQYGMDQIFNQYRWLEEDLRGVREAKSQQWIVVTGHRPLYCSNPDPVDCNPWGSVLRNGISMIGVPGLEHLFHRYGVDLYIGAHEHSYERLWPVYDRRVMNGSYAAPYTDPQATTYLITGAAGNREGQTQFRADPFDYSAVRSMDYGFTRLRAYNATHMHLDEVSVEANGTVIDDFWMIKSEPTPAWLRQHPGKKK